MSIEITAPIGTSARANQAKHRALFELERAHRVTGGDFGRYVLNQNIPAADQNPIEYGFETRMFGSVWTFYGGPRKESA